MMCLALFAGTFKNVASLRNASLQQICGAIIISPDFALTAAHCVHGNSNFTLSFNNYCIGSEDTYPTAQVLDIITHPQYDKASSAHDISVLRISHNLSDVSWLNDTILPSFSFGITGECTIYGYGYKDVSEQVSEILVAAKVFILSLDQCIQLLGQYVAPLRDSGMICASGGNSDTCQGDSGGPLMCDGRLQGISSYGLACGLAGVPGVYVSIGPHLNWIRNITNIL
ncbi:trypsin alpha-3 isoform X2 [Amyelois transitella]|uniref:trypsin alpha-3 isoform X2 n=1 Tax=Amyelois transitella TaxID=680683 RepID=UPI00299057A2|nr:trypsin alpha-3 isoform X2 [Amyelois transitella]